LQSYHAFLIRRGQRLILFADEISTWDLGVRVTLEDRREDWRGSHGLFVFRSCGIVESVEEVDRCVLGRQQSGEAMFLGAEAVNACSRNSSEREGGQTELTWTTVYGGMTGGLPSLGWKKVWTESFGGIRNAH